MRPMTETRKRRLSDPQIHNTKRLMSNEPNKMSTDHVTTRSQAKNDLTSTVTSYSRAKTKTLSNEERRLVISMRLRHEEKNTTQAFQNNVNSNLKGITRRTLASKTRILNTNNTKTNGFTTKVKRSFQSSSSAKLINRISSIDESKQEGFHQESTKTSKEISPVPKEDEDSNESKADSTPNKSKKRKSALWVLNCEAEEFLFGETAAEDQEVVLPPKPPDPAKKRRRMRATELGDLLRETSLLESKLRNSTNQVEATSGRPISKRGRSQNSSSSVKKPIRKGRVRLKPVSVDISSEDEYEEQANTSVDESEESGSNLEFPNLSFIFLGEPMNPFYRDPFSSGMGHSARLMRMIQSLEYTFSFENVPTSEVWYKTYLHQDRPRQPFLLSNPDSQVILPYETRILGRPRKTVGRPPRKSPRCHASTQAILSSLKRTRRSVLPTTPSPSPSPPTGKLSRNPNPCSQLQETSASSNSEAPSTSMSSKPLLKNVKVEGNSLTVPTRVTETLEYPSPLISANGIQNGMKNNELTATQYLWDSILFLTDPYVIQTLSVSGINQLSSAPTLLKTVSSPSSSSKIQRKNSYIKKEQINTNLNNNNFKNDLKVTIPQSSPKPDISSPNTNSQTSTSVTGNGGGMVNGNCCKNERLEPRRLSLSPVGGSKNGRTRSLFRSPSSSPNFEPKSPSASTLRKSARNSPTGSSPVEEHSRSNKLTSNKIIVSPSSKYPGKKVCYVPVIFEEKEEVLFSLPSNELPSLHWEIFS